MRRSYQWTWVGLLAAALAPGVALAQAAAPATHTVRSGDTLWDLARQYRGDPFLWPDIYRMNTSVVEDPHWIYPGEVLRLAGADTVPSVPTTDTPEPPAQVATAAGTDSTAGADTAAEAPQKTLAQLAAVSATDPGTDDQGLFGPRRSRMMEETLKAYTEQPYRALRPSEFYSSGFLTENDRLPFGKVLGPVIPEQIRSSSAQATALPLTAIAVEAPRGGSYQIGDTLLVLQLGPELRSYGEVVVPTGLARVVDTVQGRFVAELVATYGPVRQGQRVLPAEKFTPSGDAHAVPVNDGVQATFIGGAGRQDLKAPQMVVFLDKGRRDGVAPGDLFEIRRHPERLPDGRQLMNDVMATVQVVHVREHTATGRVLNVLSPDIAPGTEARQIARLPS
ncbi:MAG TPA: LysM peptidoglycan-binding domain-containing protein [Gemmatimonadales bacterium]